MSASPRLLLGLAAVAVAFAAADTYVVVLALPDMMAGAGLAVDELQRAAPIVSGFLLGYVAMLPMIGRIADLRGRVPVLVSSHQSVRGNYRPVIRAMDALTMGMADHVVWLPTNSVGSDLRVLARVAGRQAF